MFKYLRYQLWLWITQHKKGLKAGDNLTDPNGQEYEIIDPKCDQDGGEFIDLSDLKDGDIICAGSYEERDGKFLETTNDQSG